MRKRAWPGASATAALSRHCARRRSLRPTVNIVAIG